VTPHICDCADGRAAGMTALPGGVRGPGGRAGPRCFHNAGVAGLGPFARVVVAGSFGWLPEINFWAVIFRAPCLFSAAALKEKRRRAGAPLVEYLPAFRAGGGWWADRLWCEPCFRAVARVSGIVRPALARHPLFVTRPCLPAGSRRRCAGGAHLVGRGRPSDGCRRTGFHDLTGWRPRPRRPAARYCTGVEAPYSPRGVLGAGLPSWEIFLASGLAAWWGIGPWWRRKDSGSRP